MRFIIVLLMLAGTSFAADTEIHRCLLEDGSTAFQETPCPEPEADEVVDDSSEPASPPQPSEPTLPEPVSQNRAECEKTTRDAIDAIDLTMREKAYSKEQGQEYLAELLALTRQLRACKRL